MIKVNHLDKYFNRRQKNEIHVLNDINLEFPEKGLVVLLGASGSGKTTLLNVIGGLDKVQSGSIEFGDQLIEDYNASTWDKIRNDSVGYIFQNYNLLPELSVFDNIGFVLKMVGINDPELIETRVNYILKAVNMYPFRKKKALQLSGGQQQRVAIARALVKNPKVIIADEPTGNLDSKNTMDIMNIIKQISLDKLVVLVTHEKEIAKFYGDRIIEIKDGQVINDYDNAESESQKIGKDDTIYLKDLKSVSKLDNQKLKMALYSDHDEITEPISVRLIIKNKTLYLDVDSSIDKIKFVDHSTGVVIKDEHFVQKSRQELIETSFNLDVLENKNVNRESKAMVSVKQTFLMALRKILLTSRKGKLMLFSFLVAGIVIAFTIATLASAVIVKPEPYMEISKDYVSIYKKSELSNWPSYEALMAYGIGDEDYYIHTFEYANLSFLNPNGSFSSVSLNGQIELIDHVSSKQLAHGRMPANDYEILISKKIADRIVETSYGQEQGIWSYSHIYFERIVIADRQIRVVGIVDTDINLIYMTRDLANLYMSIDTSEMPYTFIAESQLIAGAMPDEGQVVLTEEMYDTLFGNDDYSGTWPKSFVGYDYQISGVYESVEQLRLMQSADLEKLRYSTSNSVYVYSNNPEELALELELLSGLTVIDVYQDAYDNAKSQQQLLLLTTQGPSILLIAFAMVGFYFVIRSSLISRIYEVSVYRALGVKKNEIFVSFIIEIFILTTTTTMVGYILGTLALSKLQEGVLGDFNLFLVTPITVIAGIIVSYVINMLAGLFPVYMLLRKTPAQILSQYDI